MYCTFSIKHRPRICTACSPTFTAIMVHVHTYTLAHSHTLMLFHAYTNTHTLSHTLIFSHTHKHCTLTYSPTHAQSRRKMSLSSAEVLSYVQVVPPTSSVVFPSLAITALCAFSIQMSHTIIAILSWRLIRTIPSVV